VSFGLPADVVDLWTVDLGADGDDPLVLSPEESTRAGRFRDPRNGERWRRARTALRRLLADYVDVDPRELVLRTARRGKPFLAEPASDIRFNVSHAGSIALLAFARGTEVGVDVELRSRRFDALALSRQAFGEAHVRALRELPPDRREEAFLHAWVRHEATAKCLGDGLGAPVPVGADVWVTDLDLGPETVAALAARGEPRSIRFREYAVTAQSR
jgi:4'-phosphopantetheinyl transferase